MLLGICPVMSAHCRFSPIVERTGPLEIGRSRQNTNYLSGIVTIQFPGIWAFPSATLPSGLFSHCSPINPLVALELKRCGERYGDNYGGVLLGPDDVAQAIAAQQPGAS